MIIGDFVLYCIGFCMGTEGYGRINYVRAINVISE